MIKHERNSSKLKLRGIKFKNVVIFCTVAPCMLFHSNSCTYCIHFNTLRMGSFKLFKRPFPGFLTILTLNAEINPICYLLALLAHHFLHVSRIRVNQLLYCVSLKIYNKFANYFCELKFSGNTHQRP